MIPSISSDRTSVKRRASCASRRAYESAPTRTAWNRPGSGDDDAPGEHLVAFRLRHRVGFAGEQRLVHLEPVRALHPTVGRDLVAGAQREEIVDDDGLDRDLRGLTVPDDARSGGVEHREPVEGALRSVLLHDADERVRDQHEAEQRVLDRPDDQDHDEHRAEDRVEPGEDVGPRDLGKRAARAVVGRVDLPARDAVGDGGRAQPFRPGGGGGFGRRGQLGRGRCHARQANARRLPDRCDGSRSGAGHVLRHAGRMRAFQFTEWQRPPELRDVAVPEPGPGEVLVRVAASGACHSDLHIMDVPAGFMPFTPPFTLGHETTGHVAAFGPGVERWQPRRRGGDLRTVGLWCVPAVSPVGRELLRARERARRRGRRARARRRHGGVRARPLGPPARPTRRSRSGRRRAARRRRVDPVPRHRTLAHCTRSGHDRGRHRCRRPRTHGCADPARTHPGARDRRRHGGHEARPRARRRRRRSVERERRRRRTRESCDERQRRGARRRLRRRRRDVGNRGELGPRGRRRHDRRPRVGHAAGELRDGPLRGIGADHILGLAARAHGGARSRARGQVPRPRRALLTRRRRRCYQRLRDGTVDGRAVVVP